MEKSAINETNYINEALPPIYSKRGEKSQDEMLLMELTNFSKTSDKKISWFKVMKALNYWMDIPHDKLAQIEEIVKIVYYANLLIEEVKETVSPTNGVPDVFCKNGELGSTINGAYYSTFIAMEKTADLDEPKAIRVFAEQIAEIYRGQGMETRWQDSVTCPTEEEYYKMTKRKSPFKARLSVRKQAIKARRALKVVKETTECKNGRGLDKKGTAALFELAIKLMQVYTVNRTDCTKLFEILAVSLHIIDGYSKIYCDDYDEEKDFCGDLTDGKFSFPIVHAIQTHINDRILLRIFRKRPKDLHVKKYFVSLIENCGTFEYTKNKLKELRDDAMQELQRLGGNPLMEDVISQLFKDVL